MRVAHWLPALTCLAFLLPYVALEAEEQPMTYDRVVLSAAVEAEVENDLLVAVLYAQREGREAAVLAAEVNQAIGWALDRAKTLEQLQVSTLGYRTNPIYNKQTLTGWRVRQSMRLQSKDASALSGLIGELQQRLAVESIKYEISPQRRREAEDQLTRDAITAFKQRADLIAEELGQPKYRLVELQVNTGGGGPTPIYRAAAMDARVAAAPPVLEAGTGTVRIEVNGTIELQVQ